MLFRGITRSGFLLAGVLAIYFECAACFLVPTSPSLFALRPSGSARILRPRSLQVGRSAGKLLMAAPKLNDELKDEVFGLERAQAEEDEIVQMENAGMASKDVSLKDVISLWVTNIILTYGDKDKYAGLQDGAVVSEGVVDDLVGGPLFLPLYKYYQECGGLYKLCFGPKVFMVASDPMVIRHILKDNVFSYDKGVLSEILEPFMGQDTVIDMEENWNSCSLDIIGKAVFNYDFGSVEKVSPVVKAALGALREAEHRSTFYLPYWKIPGLGAEWPIPALVPRQRKFQQDMHLLNTVLDELILNVVSEKEETDLDALIAKDYANVKDPSLLRFLVDVRGGDATQKQLRDDLITLLIAGHETTGSMLTWATWLLTQYPEAQAKMQGEIDRVLGGRAPTYDDMPQLEQVRFVITETLRLYPEPPILIRRALEPDVLPKASFLDGRLQDDNVKVLKGSDFFISIWNLHRSPLLWDKPDVFDPDRWSRPTPQHIVDKYNAGRQSEEAPKWNGYAPNPNVLYPNEIMADYAFLPFGAGPRKCLGDQFAMMESVVMLCVIFQRYEFELVGTHNPTSAVDSDVGMMFGATIHTQNGLKMKVKRRQPAA